MITEEILVSTKPADRLVQYIMHINANIMRMDTMHKERGDFYLAYTKSLGAAFRYKKGEDSQKEMEYLLNQDFLSVPIVNNAIRIALLDSIYPLCRAMKPDAAYTITDIPDRKILWRSNIIADEVKRLVGEGDKAVLNVGVVENIVRVLLDKHYRVIGTDFNEGLIGAKLFGRASVFSGEETLALAAKADVVVATGMTIVTETLDDIITVCKKNNTKLILFSETGENLGSYYVKNGVDAYISEIYPWYLFPGTSTINVYRAN